MGGGGRVGRAGVGGSGCAHTGHLRVVTIELQLMLLWSHMKYHFGIICNFLQSFSVTFLSS